MRSDSPSELGDGAALSADRTPPTHPTVLVVDDADEMQAMLTVVLTTAGFDVVTADNGFDAVMIALRTPPALILMDIRMPVLSGVAAAQLLKAAAETRDVPIVAHSGSTDNLGPDAAQLFAGVLAKPCRPDVLLDLAATLLGRANAVAH